MPRLVAYGATWSARQTLVSLACLGLILLLAAGFWAGVLGLGQLILRQVL